MKRLPRTILFLILLASLGSGVVLAGGDVSLVVGRKLLGDDNLEAAGVDDQVQFGVALSLEFDWPVAIAIDLLTSSADATTNEGGEFPLERRTEAKTIELDLGVRRFWGERYRPYVGGGFAYIQLDATQTESGMLGPGAPYSYVIVDDSDQSLGYWIGTGIHFRIVSGFHLGLDLRLSDADVELASGVTVDAGSTQYALTLGYHW